MIGDAPRKRLCGGPFIDQGTLSSLKQWQDRGTSYGISIDRVVFHAKSTGFDPVTNKTKKRTTSKG